MGKYNIQIPVSRQKASASQFAVPVRDAINDLDDRVSNSSNPTIVRKLTDEPVTNSIVLHPDPELVAPVLANTFYQFDAGVFYTGTAAGKIQFGWLAPAGASFVWAPDCLDAGITANTSGITDRSQKFTTNVVTMGVDGATVCTARPSGLLFIGSTPGVFQARFAQVVAAASTSAVLKAQSWLKLTPFS